MQRDPCASVIAKTIEAFLTLDNVYFTAFASLIIIQTAPGAALQRLPQLNDSMLLEFPVKEKIITASVLSHEGELPSGPYFIQDGVIHEAWRLYSDELDEFEITVVPHIDTNVAKLGSLILSKATQH